MSVPPCMESIMALLLVSTMSGFSWVTLLPWTAVSMFVKWSSFVVLFTSIEVA